MIHSITKFLIFIFFKVFFSLKIKGRENIPLKGPFIIAPNHTSYLDPLVAGCVCRRKMYYMAKEELFKNRLIGWYLTRLNLIPLKRYSGDRKALKEAFERLRKGMGLLIFPEGTRSDDGEIKEGKIGISVLSHMGKAPVVPCYVHGSFQLWPSNRRFFKRGKLGVYFGKPLILPTINEKAKKTDYYNFAQIVVSNIKALKR